MKEPKEADFYHALNICHQADYAALGKIKDRFGSWAKAWQSGAGRGTSPEKASRELSALDIKLILREDDDFPSSLREIPHSPFGLYVLGRNLGPSDKPDKIVAIVGTRKATPEGKALARQFAGKFAARGLVVVSGLALGIDAAAHEGCFSENGRTVAVMPGGLDRIYPRTNETLARKIMDTGGVLISEYPPGMPILPYRFLERNRIVSGLSRGVLIVEAGLRSGSLATARFAMEQNRDVFVLPGPVRHPNYKGSNLLIRAGAELVTEPEQILEDWDLLPEEDKSAIRADDSRETVSILTVLLSSKSSLEIDKIAELVKLDVQTTSQALSLLVLTDRINETPLGYSAKK
ncbi:MAG: DNA-processing protein DprA [Candidatus Liptonbacteria bacterium]